jgi:zinc transporter 1/2/3
MTLGSVAIKWVGVATIPLITLLGALLPLFFNFNDHHFLMSLANVFAGSILLGFGFLHVLPEANATFIPYADDYGIGGNNYPMINGIAMIAFFAMVLIEHVVLNIGSRSPATHPLHALHLHTLPTESSGALPYILTAGLSFHSFFEGLAIGLEKTPEGVGVILFSVLIHKWLESFSIAVAFVRSPVSRKKSIFTLFVFSLLTPLGIIIGIMFGSTSDFLDAVMNALSAGVFIYVAILGMIVEELKDKNNGSLVVKVLLGVVTCLGIGCLAFLG